MCVITMKEANSLSEDTRTLRTRAQPSTLQLIPLKYIAYGI